MKNGPRGGQISKDRMVSIWELVAIVVASVRFWTLDGSGALVLVDSWGFIFTTSVAISGQVLSTEMCRSIRPCAAKQAKGNPDFVRVGKVLREGSVYQSRVVPEFQFFRNKTCTDGSREVNHASHLQPSINNKSTFKCNELDLGSSRLDSSANQVLPMTTTMLTGDVCVAKKLRGLKLLLLNPLTPSQKDCPPGNAAKQHLPNNDGVLRSHPTT
jgi:hypothetical protein